MINIQALWQTNTTLRWDGNLVVSADEATQFNCHHLKHGKNFGVCTVLKSDAWICFINSSGYNRDFLTDHLDYQLFYHVSQIQVYHNQHLCQQNFNFDAIQQMYHLVSLS